MAQCVVCSSEIRDDARFCPSCGAEQPKVQVAGSSDDPLMGKVVARKFKIEKLLGVGGMGKVYKARQLSLDKAVVVKVLHDHFREDPQLVQRFQREAKAASRLNHPNSIQIIDFGQDEGGVVFMAMEFLQGQDLFAALKKDGPLPADRIAKIMVQVCSALAEAHEQHVVHRDLKPENIMVEDRRGQKDYVKVLDFGIAKIQDPGEGQQALTQAGMVCGTPEYMSPEQARGLQLDPRSDIYALGVVMYQLAVGELPFIADTPIGIVTKHILEKPVPPRQRAPHLNIPEGLEVIILKAMEKEADKRYSTVSEMQDALEALRGSLTPQSGSVPMPRAVSAEGSQPFPRSVSDPSQPNPQSSGPTKTAPTPTSRQPAVESNVTELQPHEGSPAVVPPPRSGVKIAPIAFVAALFVAGGAGVALKDKICPPPLDAVDAGLATTVVDAGTTVVATKSDAGNPSIDRPPAIDAGTTAPPVVDAGVRIASKPDAGVRINTPPPPPPPPPPSGCPAAAGKPIADAVKLYKPDTGGDCDASMNSFVGIATKFPTCAEPYKYMAFCYGRSGANQDLGRACKAAKKFHDLKGTSETKAAKMQFDRWCK